MPYICHKWDQTEIKWNVANWKWSECQFVLDLFSAGSTGIPGELALPKWLHEETQTFWFWDGMQPTATVQIQPHR